MITRRFKIPCLIFVIFTFQHGQGVSQAQEKSHSATATPISAFFADDTIAYVEVPDPAALVSTIVDHTVVAAVLETEAVKKGLFSPQYLQFRTGLGFLEGQVGMGWQELVSHLAKNGLAASLASDGRSYVVIARSDDEAILRKTVGTILDFVKQQAGNRKSPFEIEENASGKLAIFDNLVIARSGADLVLASNKKQAVDALDRLTGKMAATSSLSSSKLFSQASSNSPPNQRISAFVNLEYLRNRGQASQLFAGMSENPAAELIFGGVLEALKDSGWATGSISLDEGNISLALATEHDPKSVDPSREYFFGPEGNASASDLIDADGMLANLSAWRDLGGWWLSKEELFDDGMVAQLVQADSQLTTFFSGLDFGGEVLGAIEPGVQIIADRQEYDAKRNPSVKIPAFAITGKLREPEAMGRRFKSAFQNLMGLVNYGLGQQGQPQFDLDTANTKTGCICSARPFNEESAPTDLLVFNFSPTLVIDGDLLVISSTTELGEKVAKLRVPDGAMPSVNSSGKVDLASPNTLLHIDLAAAVEALDENREGLIAQNMLENGRSREDAAAEIGSAIELAKLLKTLDATLGVASDRLQFDLNVSFAK